MSMWPYVGRRTVNVLNLLRPLARRDATRNFRNVEAWAARGATAFQSRSASRTVFALRTAGPMSGGPYPTLGYPAMGFLLPGRVQVDPLPRARTAYVVAAEPKAGIGPPSGRACRANRPAAVIRQQVRDRRAAARPHRAQSYLRRAGHQLKRVRSPFREQAAVAGRPLAWPPELTEAFEAAANHSAHSQASGPREVMVPARLTSRAGTAMRRVRTVRATAGVIGRRHADGRRPADEVVASTAHCAARRCWC